MESASLDTNKKTYIRTHNAHPKQLPICDARK